MNGKHVLGPDIHLDVEVLQDKKGRRISEARAQRFAKEALTKARVPAELKHRLEPEASAAARPPRR